MEDRSAQAAASLRWILVVYVRKTVGGVRSCVGATCPHMTSIAATPTRRLEAPISGAVVSASDPYLDPSEHLIDCLNRLPQASRLAA